MEILDIIATLHRLDNRPKDYPLMVLREDLSKRVLSALKKTFHILRVSYYDTPIYAIVPNIYKSIPASKKPENQYKVIQLRQRLNPNRIEPYEKAIDIGDGTAIMPFNPKIPKTHRDIIEKRYIIRTHNKQQGVACVYYDKTLTPEQQEDLKEKNLAVIDLIKE